MECKHIISSFKYAISGIRHCFKTQRNMKVHLIIGIIVLLAGIALGISMLEYALLSIAIGLVLAAESFNTVVEHVIDILSPQQKESARLAKDIAAGAVLIAVVTSVVIGLIVFLPYLAFLY